MGNVIHTEAPSKRREKILRLIATMLKISDLDQVYNDEYKDKVAFIYLSLLELDKTISETVSPWEKRDYWLKADKFRKEWNWVKTVLTAINAKMFNKKWSDIGIEIDYIKSKMTDLEPLKRMSNTKFWDGAYKTYLNQV